MVAKWTGVAVSLDGLGEHDLVDLVCCDTGLGMGSGNLKHLAGKLLSEQSKGKTRQLSLFNVPCILGELKYIQ